MLKKLCLPVVLSFGLLFSAVGHSDDFAVAWEAADQARKEAGKVGYEWRDTAKLLKKAQAAAEKGEMAKAMKLVAQAHEQAEDGIAQAARESELWMARVPQ